MKERVTEQLKLLLEQNSDVYDNGFGFDLNNDKVHALAAPHKAIINLLHHNKLASLEAELMEFVNSGNHFYEIQDGKVISKVPNSIYGVNQEKYLSPLYDYALDKAFDHSLKTILNKYKITEESNIQKVQYTLAGIYLESQKDIRDESNLKQFSTLLLGCFIENRLNKYCTLEQLNIFKINLPNYSTILSSKDKTLFVEKLKNDLGLSADKAISIGKTFDKFNYTHSEVDKIIHKVLDDIETSIHKEIAQETFNLNGLKQHTFDGTEVLWRGVTVHPKYTLDAILNDNLNPSNKFSFYLPLQDSTLVQEIIGGICTSAGLYTPIDFTFNENGYLIEILPHKGDKGILFHDYSPGVGVNMVELDFSHIYNHNIYKVYKISRLDSDDKFKIRIEEVYLNKHYLKGGRKASDALDFERGDIITIKNLLQEQKSFDEGFELIEIKRGDTVSEHKVQPALVEHFKKALENVLEQYPDFFTDFSEESDDDTYNGATNVIPISQEKEAIIDSRNNNFELITYKLSDIDDALKCLKQSNDGFLQELLV